MDQTLSVNLSGEFKVCTILFSDVVTFTNICAACEPIQIVNMLNAMYSRFDRLTNIHTVYKVCVGLVVPIVYYPSIHLSTQKHTHT